MYVTRPLSLYRKYPSVLSAEPDAPYSGLLVFTDEEAEAQDSSCCGLCKRDSVTKLPFPQDKILTIFHSSDYTDKSATKIWFIPVLGQPLSSNRYYVVRAKGRYQGKLCTSSKDSEMALCCFPDFMRDKKPKPFNHRNIYQQFKIHRHYRSTFFAKSVAPDGIPPKFLRKKGWEVRVSSSRKWPLKEGLGLDSSLRTRLPDFNFTLSSKRSASLVVGTWYCPFIFVREHGSPRKHMKRSLLYRMTLEQWWEKIYSCENVSDERRSRVKVDTVVEREVQFVNGMKAAKDERSSNKETWVWFKRIMTSNRGKMSRVGLSCAIFEKMNWVQEEGGWIGGGESDVSIEREEEIVSERSWRRFGCYVLVESFVLRRTGGKIVLRCDFRHTDRIRCKWE